MKIVFLSFLFIAFGTAMAQVGIGTNSPNNNAILDLTSANKALLLPRVADTSLVATPAAGMVVYSQQSQSPNFHDGARWNNLNAGQLNAVYGTISYTISAGSPGGIPFATGPLPMIDFDNYTYTTGGGGGGGQGSVQKRDSVTIFKEFDANSIGLKRAHLAGLVIQNIEISQFLPDGTKYYSIKLTGVTVKSQQNLISPETGKLTERYGLSAGIIGYKDWINNKSFSLNLGTSEFGTY